MKPFYVRHKTREEAIEVIDRAVAHGATLCDGVNDYHEDSIIRTDRVENWLYVGVSENNNTMFYETSYKYGPEAQELTLQQVRELYPLPHELPELSPWVTGGPVTPDPGQHYRFTYKGIKLDPFRIAQVYGITDFGQQTILKKALRMGTAHKDRQQDLKDIICAAERMLEMMEDDSNDMRTVAENIIDAGWCKPKPLTDDDLIPLMDKYFYMNEGSAKRLADAINAYIRGEG